MKRLISFILCISLITSLGVFVSYGSDVTESGRISVYNTEITIPGLKNTYKFLQISDTHYCVLPEDTSSYLYSYASQRRNSFNSYIDYDYVETLQEYYDYAREQNVSAVIMTGDIVDYPSDENIAFLENTVKSNSDIETMFTLGNHDWTYPDASFGYGPCFSSDQVNILQPKFFDLCCEEGCGNTGNASGSYIDFGEVVVVMLNDSVDYFPTTKCYTLLQNALSLNKPTIVCYHVPLYSDSLTKPVTEMWGYNCIVGSHRGGTYWPLVSQYIVSLLETNENVVGLLCGHIHFGDVNMPYDSSFSQTDKPSNGALQYSCPPGYDAKCRLITVKGTDADCKHDFETKFFNDADCKTKRVLEKTCKSCGYVTYEFGEMGDHDYEITISQKPTCTEKGKARKICSLCRNTVFEDIEATGHSYNEGTVISEPTYFAEGYTKYECTVCGDTDVRTVPKKERIIGDANLDGIVSVEDILYEERFIKNIDELDEMSAFSCDMNSDGRVAMDDLLTIAKIVQGLI